VRLEQLLADWGSALEWRDVPGDTRERVEVIHLDALASGAAGATTKLAADAAKVASAFGADSAAARTFARAYEITSATLCDVYRPGLCHVTPVVLPPLEALGAEPPSEDFYAAFTVGLEVTTRLCRALNYPRLRERGWHSPGVAGPVGAAAAAARWLKLDANGMRNAMAHGAAQAAGTFAALGTEAVKFNQARGSLAGLLAAIAASSGLQASPTWFTADDGGLMHSYTDDAHPELLVEGLGEHWELEQISLRRWPAASSVQSLIEVCLDLELPADDVASMAIELSPRGYEVSGDRGWDTPLAAQQSARWVAACLLLDGEWWLGHIDEERISDRATAAVAERIRVTPADDILGAGVRVRVKTRDGRTIDAERDDAPGDPERPLSRADVEQKLLRATKDLAPA
jgi:2-methylcitrate dehydratase PrpD